MKKYGKIALIAFLMWAIPYFSSFLFFPLMDSDIHYFKTIMIVIGNLSWAGLAFWYFNDKNEDFLRDGIILGLLGLIMNLILDIPGILMFNKELTYVTYLKEIGFRYLAIPINAILVGLLLERKTVKTLNNSKE